MLPNAAPMVLPLVDLDVLSHLERQLDDSGPAHAFARDYITGFRDRFFRLTRAIGDHDVAAALDAALSLRNSSAMVGAARLSAMAQTFETAVVSADLDTARSTLPAIELCGLETISELEGGYLAAA